MKLVELTMALFHCMTIRVGWSNDRALGNRGQMLSSGDPVTLGPVHRTVSRCTAPVMSRNERHRALNFTAPVTFCDHCSSTNRDLTRLRSRSRILLSYLVTPPTLGKDLLQNVGTWTSVFRLHTRQRGLPATKVKR